MTLDDLQWTSTLLPSTLLEPREQRLRERIDQLLERLRKSEQLRDAHARRSIVLEARLKTRERRLIELSEQLRSTPPDVLMKLREMADWWASEFPEGDGAETLRAALAHLDARRVA